MKTAILLFCVIFPFIISGQTFYKRYGNSFSGIVVTTSQDSNLLIGTNPPGLLKTDLSGNFIFQKSYAGFSISTMINSIVSSEENGAFLTLTVNNLYDKGAWLLKVDSLGNPIWLKKLTLSTSTTTSGLIKLHDGNLLLTGTDSSSALVVKIDTSGHEIWSKRFHNNYQQTQKVSPPVELPDHTIIFCGGLIENFTCLTNVPPYHPTPITSQLAYSIKLDSVGNIIFSKGFYFTTQPYYQNGIYLYGTNVFRSSENKIYLSYGVYYIGMWENSTYFYLARLNENGIFEIAKTGYEIYPPKIINENSDSSFNVLFNNSTASLSKFDFNFNCLNRVIYYPFGSISNPLANVTLYSAIALPNKKLVFTGNISGASSGVQNGVSLLLSDSTGYEDCTSLILGPYVPSIDTLYTAHDLVFQIDTGITIQNIIISSSNISPNICFCIDNPIANFSFILSDSVVSFTNTSTLATSYHWYFGDGGSSTEENPIHTYSDTGTFQVSLYVFNNCGMDLITFPIFIDSVNSIETINTLKNAVSLFPNPANNLLHVNTGFPFTNYEIINSTGETLYRTDFNNEIDVSFLSPGIYLLKLFNTNTSNVKLFNIIK